MKLVSLKNLDQDAKAQLRRRHFLPSSPYSVAGEAPGGALCCQAGCALEGCSRSAPARCPSSFACHCLETQTRKPFMNAILAGGKRSQWGPARRTSQVSLGEDAEEGERVAVHAVVRVRRVQTLQQVSDVTHVDAGLAHSVRLWRERNRAFNT